MFGKVFQCLFTSNKGIQVLSVSKIFIKLNSYYTIYLHILDEGDGMVGCNGLRNKMISISEVPPEKSVGIFQTSGNSQMKINSPAMTISGSFSKTLMDQNLNFSSVVF